MWNAFVSFIAFLFQDWLSHFWHQSCQLPIQKHLKIIARAEPSLFASTFTSHFYFWMIRIMKAKDTPVPKTGSEQWPIRTLERKNNGPTTWIKGLHFSPSSCFLFRPAGNTRHNLLGLFWSLNFFFSVLFQLGGTLKLANLNFVDATIFEFPSFGFCKTKA